MIQLIEGPPGSGKSVFAVNYLVGFTGYDELYNEYILREDVLIISNIEGLKIKHWELSYCLKDKTVEDFFSISNFENIQKKTGKSHIILCVDECHELFPPGFKSKEVYEFFAFHRHIGLDVILMTQGIESMSRMFNPLLEFIIKATPRSKKVTKSFTYKYHDLRGRFLYPKTIACKDLIFNAYKSFRQDEKNKPRSAVVFWMCVVGLLFVAGGALFWVALSGFSEKSQESQAKIESLEGGKPNIEGVKFVPSDAPKNLPPADESEEWQLLYLDGYLEKQGHLWFLIKGRAVYGGPRFRNFDRLTLSVEYFGPSFEAGNDSAPLREGVRGRWGEPKLFGSSEPPSAESEPEVHRIEMPPNRQSKRGTVYKWNAI